MRDHGMFGYLGQDVGPKKHGLDTLKEFAKQAASAFLSKDEVPLNHTIQKIAKVENLNPDQISILCQEANKQTHGHLFKTASNKYVDFELAESDVIVSNLDEKLSKTASATPGEAFDKALGSWGHEKTASQSSSSQVSEFDFAPGEQIAPDFQYTGQSGHNGLTSPLYHVEKKAHQDKMQKIAELQDKQIILKGHIESLEKSFIKQARNSIMGYSLKERPEKLALVSHFCKEAGMSDERRDELMDLTSHVMKSQGLLEKTADIKADEKYISENLDARIVNGTHPLYITLKTIIDKDKNRCELERDLNVIKTTMEGGVIQSQDVKEL